MKVVFSTGVEEHRLGKGGSSRYTLYDAIDFGPLFGIRCKKLYEMY
jgi:hypothetical protein